MRGRKRTAVTLAVIGPPAPSLRGGAPSVGESAPP